MSEDQEIRKSVGGRSEDQVAERWPSLTVKGQFAQIREIRGFKKKGAKVVDKES